MFEAHQALPALFQPNYDYLAADEEDQDAVKAASSGRSVNMGVGDWMQQDLSVDPAYDWISNQVRQRVFRDRSLLFALLSPKLIYLNREFVCSEG